MLVQLQSRTLGKHLDSVLGQLARNNLLPTCADGSAVLLEAGDIYNCDRGCPERFHCQWPPGTPSVSQLPQFGACCLDTEPVMQMFGMGVEPCGDGQAPLIEGDAPGIVYTCDKGCLEHFHCEWLNPADTHLLSLGRCCPGPEHLFLEGNRLQEHITTVQSPQIRHCADGQLPLLHGEDNKIYTCDKLCLENFHCEWPLGGEKKLELGQCCPGNELLFVETEGEQEQSKPGLLFIGSQCSFLFIAEIALQT